MSTVDRPAATIDDLSKAEGKAELVNGEIVSMSPSGFWHLKIASLIFISLNDYERKTSRGVALGDGGGFLCDLPHRQSFSPDCSYYLGRLPASGHDFLPEPPTFAVEIRSANDYGPAAELKLADKRADYFAAGTKAVWDVDPEGPLYVKLFLADQPNDPIAFQAGDLAHAEPVLPGWRLNVNDITDSMRMK
jgi:Uma2 family endonuclease